MEYVIISDEMVPTDQGVVRFKASTVYSILQMNGKLICNHFVGFFTISEETLQQYFKLAPSKLPKVENKRRPTDQRKFESAAPLSRGGFHKTKRINAKFNQPLK